MNQLQERIPSIYEEVAQVYNMHDVTYFAIGGTCLRAVRHQELISWDDDLDIAIPIEQYQSFLAMSKEELQKYPEAYHVIKESIFIPQS